MRPVLVNHTDRGGGAATATRRIFTALRKNGIDVSLVVDDKTTSNKNIHQPQSIRYKLNKKARETLSYQALRFYEPNRLFSTPWVPSQLPKKINELRPDVVHLNWVAGTCLRPKALRQLNAPIVWRCPDMWPLTGGCHYAEGCTKFTESCGKCPALQSGNPSDLSNKYLQRRKDVWSDLDITIVAPCRWLAEQASRSTLFRNNEIRVIPNTINTKIFSPKQDRTTNQFGLAENKITIVFGAVAATDDQRKGFDLLVDSLSILDNHLPKDAVEVAVFGSERPASLPDIGFEFNFTGYINDEERLAHLYSAADLMVVPSRWEGFGLTALEASSCGTPVVAFDTSGLSDTVDHKETGFLAEPFEPDSLAEGIKWVLADEERTERLGEAARNKAVNRYSYSTIANEYFELYNKVST